MVGTVHQAVLKVIGDAQMQANLAQLGLDAVGDSPAELGTIMKSDIAKWARVIREAGIEASE